MKHDDSSDHSEQAVITTVDPPMEMGNGPGRSLHVVLVEPQIPPNTGSIARLCAATGAWLHLVKPLAFELDSARLKRAGLDYWPNVRLSVHENVDAFLRRCHLPSATLFTKRAERLYTDVRYPPSTVLVFGQETKGLGPALLERYSERLARIPISDRVRSLNLANAVSIAVYEVIRQHGGLFDPV